MTRIVMLPCSMQLRTGVRAVCGMCGKCGLVARASTPLHGLYQTYVKCRPETAKTRRTVVYALRGAERTLDPSVLYFQNIIPCQTALRAHRISPTSIKELGNH